MRKNYNPRFTLALLVCIFLPSIVFAERLTFKTYTSADGLANDSVNMIRSDSRGFLWFCTGEGLSRFDGYNFKTYTQNDGLPHRNINDFFETSDGTYLLATTNGLSVFNPDGKRYKWDILQGKLLQDHNEPPIFKTYIPINPERPTSHSVLTIAQDANGTIYAGTDHGLYRFIRDGSDWKFDRVRSDGMDRVSLIFNYLFTDSQKNVWLAANEAIYLMSPDGAIKEINDKGGNSVYEDREGRVWVDSGGNDLGIRIYNYPKDSATPELIYTFTTKDGLNENGFSNAIAETTDGRILVQSKQKLLEYPPNMPPGQQKFGVLENDVTNAAVDKSGSIWFNLFGKGIAKYSPNSVTVYDQRDGIPNDFITSIFGNKQNELFFTVGRESIMRFNNGKIEGVVPFQSKGRLWGATFLDFQATSGEWWATSGLGLLRYPRLKSFKDLGSTPPSHVYTMNDGLFSTAIFYVFQDSRQNIWLTAGGNENTLNRIDADGRVERFTTENGLPKNSGAIAYGEDSSGNIWIGYYYGQLVRYKDGAFRSFNTADGFPEGSVAKMVTDDKGRLWVGTFSRGLFRIDNPNDDHPSFTNISTADGLSSNQAQCLVKDQFGRIYIGTGSGINRLDPETNQIKVYTVADGLPGNIISECYADTSGILWFGSNNSLIRFEPRQEQSVSPPSIFIEKFSVNGKNFPVSEMGEKSIENIELASDERQFQISFFALLFGTGERLLYQYRIGDQPWSTPSDQRSLQFNLTPGTYTFEVRAVNSDGALSDPPARISFKILSPIWQRWWFIGLVLFIVGGAIFSLDRYRVAKTRQVENALNETRRANVMIRESENRFRTLADTASDAIFTIDDEKRIVFVNEAIETVFGYKPGDLIGQSVSLLIPEREVPEPAPEDIHKSGLPLAHLGLNGNSQIGVHKSGAEIPLEVSFGEFVRDGKRFQTGIARDISERKRAEAELQKAREEKFAELQRVRTRIATDLHDDIGSSLTQIAVLSEVARGQASHLEAESLATPLERIKNVSKELVAVMSDIVWAINPNKDFLQDLVQRMRRFGSDVFSGRQIKFELRVTGAEAGLQLGANIRREVFAIFKECINNIVKYADCTEAKVEFDTGEGWLSLTVADNGRGFDVDTILSEDFNPDMGGNGIVNMRRRAKELGGYCEVVSAPGTGTTTTVRVPLQNI